VFHNSSLISIVWCECNKTICKKETLCRDIGSNIEYNLVFLPKI